MVEALFKALFFHGRRSRVPNPTTRQSVLFPGPFRKPLVAQFDRQHASSGGRRHRARGGRSSAGPDRRAGRLPRRAPRSRQGHPLAARSTGPAHLRGDPDANDSARLGDDPIWRIRSHRATVKPCRSSSGRRVRLRMSLLASSIVPTRHHSGSVGPSQRNGLPSISTMVARRGALSRRRRCRAGTAGAWAASRADAAGAGPCRRSPAAIPRPAGRGCGDGSGAPWGA